MEKILLLRVALFSQNWFIAALPASNAKFYTPIKNIRFFIDKEKLFIDTRTKKLVANILTLLVV
jgi:hypothetical protein